MLSSLGGLIGLLDMGLLCSDVALAMLLVWSSTLRRSFQSMSSFARLSCCCLFLLKRGMLAVVLRDQHETSVKDTGADSLER